MSESGVGSSGLAGKVALITGAAGAIGRATAALIAKRGGKVVAVDRPGADFSELESALDGSAYTTFEADVTDEAQVRAFVQHALDSFGRIDIFFNNAGVEGAVAPIHELTLEQFRSTMSVNVEGVFLGLKHVLPVLIRQGSGSIINSSSGAGLGGAANLSPYVASKHAVQGLTRVAALEVADKGVRVNSVNPGPIKSRMIESLDSRAGVSEADGAASIPFGRYGLPEEVATVVAFLGSDDARYITGTHNLIDGGRGASL